MSLFNAAYQCLMTADVDNKLAMTQAVAQQWVEQGLSLTDLPKTPIQKISQPGRPSHPKLVAPRDLPRRRLSTPEGHAALLHSVTHIEFNAINLAWDAVYRFRDMPAAFYDDWVNIAKEEAEHFQLLREHVRSLGYDYGDFPAHNGLWEMAVKTDFDVLVRMALVPRVLEARGLDVTPGMMKKLEASGDQRAVEILQIILRDEIGHVAVGSRWFRHACAAQNQQPESTFKALIQEYLQGELRPPFHVEARLAAGFSQEELDALSNLQ